MAGAWCSLNRIRVLLISSGWDGNGGVTGIVMVHFKKFQVKYTVKPLLSGHPRGTTSGCRMEVGCSIEVHHKLA